MSETAVRALGEAHRYELSAGDVRIAYYERGSGTPLVLVHGMFGDWRDWAPVLEPLAESFRVIALDLPGFGESRRLAGECTLENFAASLEKFFAALALRDLLLVGNSFGGMISACYAAQHSARLHGLVLVSSAGMKEYSDEEQGLVREHFSLRNLQGLRAEFVEPLFAVNFAQRTPQRERYLEGQRGNLQRADYAEYAQVLAASGQLAFAHWVVPLLEPFQGPLLLLWGEQDQVFPLPLARAALPLLRGAELVTIPGAGHMPQMDQPENFARAVREFAERIK
ncbi:MAG: alpha/beta fold hydrolase [Acidobacteriota bacterium]|nr:alpha/beta fold hydrolase [Acidobacteriota bacterium]